MSRLFRMAAAGCRMLLAAGLLTSAAHADGIVGSSLPADFPVIPDASLGTPLLGFGAAGPVHRTPVVFVHGNNDTPFPTACNPFGKMQAFAQYLANHGYALSELWGLGYRATSATWRLTKRAVPRRPTRQPPTSRTCAASCRRCCTTPARARSTSSATAWA